MPQQTNARGWCISNESRRRRLKQNRRQARQQQLRFDRRQNQFCPSRLKNGVLCAHLNQTHIGVFAQQFGVDRPDSASRSTAFDRKRAPRLVHSAINNARTESAEWLPPSLYWPEAAVLIKRVRAEQLGDGDYLKWDREIENVRGRAGGRSPPGEAPQVSRGKSFGPKRRLVIASGVRLWPLRRDYYL